MEVGWQYILSYNLGQHPKVPFVSAGSVGLHGPLGAGAKGVFVALFLPLTSWSQEKAVGLGKGSSEPSPTREPQVKSPAFNFTFCNVRKNLPVVLPWSVDK